MLSKKDYHCQGGVKKLALHSAETEVMVAYSPIIQETYYHSVEHGK
jgi:hypothetical protein